MEKLTLEEMNSAYAELVNTFGHRIVTKHVAGTMLVTINSNCEGVDESGIVFDQNTMTIYERGGCTGNCKCKTSREKLLPVIERGIAKHHTQNLAIEPRTTDPLFSGEVFLI